MTNPAHLLLTGLVLLAAFLGGAIVGSVLKALFLAVTRPRAKKERAPQVARRGAPVRQKRKSTDDVDATVVAAMEKAGAVPATVELSVEDLLASAVGGTLAKSDGESGEPVVEAPKVETAATPEPVVSPAVVAVEPQVMGEQDFAQAMLALTKSEPVVVPAAEASAAPEPLIEEPVAEIGAVPEVVLDAEALPAAADLPVPLSVPVPVPVAAAAPPAPPAAVAVVIGPARVAGQSVSGREIADPRRGAPPRPAPRPVLRVAAPSAQVIPFPVHAPVQQVTPPAVLGEVKAELEALLQQPAALEATTFSPLPEMTVSPRLQAARAELELVSAIPVAPARPPVVLTIEPFGASPPKGATVAVEPDEARDAAGSNLPLGLESTLAEAIGATMELAPTVNESAPVPKPARSEEKPVALAAFDIVADLPEQAEAIEDLDIVPEFELVGFDLTPARPEAEQTRPVPAAEVRKDVVPAVLDPGTVPMVLDDGAAPEAAILEEAASPPVEIEFELKTTDDLVDLAQMQAALTDDLFIPDTLDAEPVTVDSDPFVAGLEQALMGASAPLSKPAVAAADETAAMQAIEGSWSPRRASPRLVRSAELPDGADANAALAASGAAVAAATRTATAVVSDLAPDPARPVALDGPRDGNADDLTHIIGVLPVIETALNKLGVYHYDQIASWSAETVAWVENHLGLDGRIQRELWRLQARELAAARPTLRKVRN
jgi:predicted flap endonuclease-1-like 5' DNA nuclease